MVEMLVVLGKTSFWPSKITCRVALESGEEVTIPCHGVRATSVMIVVSNKEEGGVTGEAYLGTPEDEIMKTVDEI